MLILADSGGSKGRRPRVWKPSPCDRHGSLAHVALPQRLLQMESDRVPPVQLPPRQPSGRTAGGFRVDPERPLWNDEIRRQENRRSCAATLRLCKSAGISTEPVPTTG